ncbi:MAG: hypothetical protein JSS90_09485 [Bacteroidetes bacterium]|jgi:hypothetical protein|nr:hypothetical protein [Bacteroidota bacterium]
MIKFRHYLILGALLLIVSFLYQHITFGNEKYERIIDSDGKGYYAYLPAVFIYHDLSFGFYFKNENKEIARYFNERFLTKQGDKTVIKTYCGEAILLLPFFASGCLTQYFIAGHTNGFEPLVQFFICAGAIFYLCLGLYAIHKFLRLFNFGEKVAFITSLGICLGTNLLTYVVFYPSMSHAYSFSMIACFIYLSFNFKSKPSVSTLLMLSILFALIILIRPVNASVALFPLILVNTEWLRFIKQHQRAVFFSALVLLAIISIQPILNYMQCGKLFPWSYGDEGFYFKHPQFINVLFSFRNGMFIYSPFLWLLIPGIVMYFLFKQLHATATLITLLVSFYFIAAWWNWSSEPALGNRSCIDWYALFAIPIASVLSIRIKSLKIILTAFMLIAIGINCIFTWQYLRDIIHPDGMTREKFKYVFLKTSKEYYGCLGNGNEESYLPAEAKPFFTYPLNHSAPTNTDSVFVFDAAHLKNAMITIENNSNILQPMKAVVSLQRLEKEFKACTDAFVIFDYTNKDGNLYYRENLRVNDIPRKQLNEWITFEYQFVMPAVKSPGDKLIFYVDNNQGHHFEMKNLQVSLYHFVNNGSTEK